MNLVRIEKINANSDFGYSILLVMKKAGIPELWIETLFNLKAVTSTLPKGWRRLYGSPGHSPTFLYTGTKAGPNATLRQEWDPPAGQAGLRRLS